MWIIGMFIFGLIAGAIARFLVPGGDRMGCFGTMTLGLIGSFVGGFLGWAFFGRDIAEGAIQTSGLAGSVFGAIVALVIFRAMAGREP